MAGRGHATADPDAPCQVELGRSGPARPRPAAEQARAAERRADRRLAEGARATVPDQALVSTARRAQETWAGVVAVAGAAPTELPAGDLPRRAGDVARRAAARATGACVLMLGHQPGIGVFAGRLLATPPATPISTSIPTAATAVVDFDVADWAEVGVGDRPAGRLHRAAAAGVERRRPAGRRSVAEDSGSGTAWSARTAGC